MDFDTEAADDFCQAVKFWEHVLPGYLSRAGADSDDFESDNGLLTPPPDCEDDTEQAWIVPPPRPTYADSWVRVMKGRVDEGYSSPSEHDSDTSSISSLASDADSRRYSSQYKLPLDTSRHYPDSADSLVFSGESENGGYTEGSTASATDAEDLFAEMLTTYTVPKDLKTALASASSPKYTRLRRSASSGKPSGISKRSSRSSLHRSPRASPRTRSFKT